MKREKYITCKEQLKTAKLQKKWTLQEIKDKFKDNKRILKNWKRRRHVYSPNIMTMIEEGTSLGDLIMDTATLNHMLLHWEYEELNKQCKCGYKVTKKMKVKYLAQ
tara:strand:- start:34 stop:351 length:318 start_codon:yes stop_codon:yes gene_type:complete